MSIGRKFILTVFITGLVLVGEILFLFHHYIIPWQVDHIVEKARAIAYFLQETTPLLQDDEKQKLVANLNGKEPDLSYLLIMDKNAKALIHSDPDRVGMVFPDQGKLSSARDGKTVEQIYTRDENNPNSRYHGERTIDIVIPHFDASGNHTGAINVGLSLKRIDLLRDQYYTVIGLSALFLTLLFSFIIYKGRQDVIMPLKSLSVMARRLGNGDLNQLIKIDKNDEIGDLAQEFNTMAKKLNSLMNRLKDKEHQLKEYIDQLITLNAKIAPDGTLLMVNETAAQLMHLPSEQLVGRKLWETPWCSNSKARQWLEEAVQKAAAGETIHYETETPLGQTKPIMIDFSLKPVFNREQQVIYLVAEGRDITERKYMEQELTASNEELTATNEELVSIEEELRATNEELNHSHQQMNVIFESITDGFLSLDPRWKITYVNREAEKLLLLHPQRVLEKNFWEVFPEVTDSLLHQQLEEVMEQQVPARFEYYYPLLNKWFAIHAYPSAGGVSIYFHDISDRKLAEEKIYFHNKYLASLHETALALMNRLDLDDLLEAILSRAGALLGTEHGWIYLVNNDKSRVVVRAGVGACKQTIGFAMKPGEGLAGKVWLSGQPMIVHDYYNWQGRSINFISTAIHSTLAVPLKSGQETIGIIGLGFVQNNRQLNDEDVTLLNGFAQLASIALENARLFKTAQQELSERTKVQELMRHQAHHDHLTDLPNRILFNQQLNHILSQADKNKEMLAVFFLDLDYFKVVNDTVGHDMGDQLLKGIAQRLSSVLYKEDIIARIGGDEFAIIVNNISARETAAVVAQKIIDSLKSPWILGSHEFHITTSIGIALYPADGQTVEILLKNADMAMYQAKDLGKNNYQFYEPNMKDRISQRLALEHSIRRGLEQGEFVIYYQPLLDLSTRKIVGIEALIRWNHPRKGLISPAEFIPVAEETGLIIPLGEWILRSACKRNKAWQDSGYPPMRMAVNLSARQFQQQKLVKKVARILEETGLDPRWLELEITESIAMKDVEFTSKMLFELQKMGITIAIDDFGTGYSSLSYLKRLPIDILKIDRSFIRDIISDPDDASIVKTIIILAHNLKMKVTAEGVETQEQLNYLRQQGCDEIQGYLFSKPLPGEEIEALLSSSSLYHKSFPPSNQNL